jgi:hypothetical protein
MLRADALHNSDDMVGTVWHGETFYLIEPEDNEQTHLFAENLGTHTRSF